MSRELLKINLNLHRDLKIECQFAKAQYEKYNEHCILFIITDLYINGINLNWKDIHKILIAVNY